MPILQEKPIIKIPIQCSKLEKSTCWTESPDKPIEMKSFREVEIFGKEKLKHNGLSSNNKLSYKPCKRWNPIWAFTTDANGY